jgi:kynurenine formamidase
VTSTLHELAGVIADHLVVDLSPVIKSNMVGCQRHPDVSVISDARNHEQHGYFLQTLVLPEHSGCHVDAPYHILSDRPERTIDAYPPDRLMGIACKIDAAELDLGPGEVLDLATYRRLADEQGVTPQRSHIALVDFGWDHYAEAADHAPPAERGWWGMNNPGFAEDLCAWLADLGVRAVGTDTFACDAAVVDGDVRSSFGHRIHFLPNDILIVEGLRNLAAVPGEFYFIALPLRIAHGSGSPLRAIGLVAAER